MIKPLFILLILPSFLFPQTPKFKLPFDRAILFITLKDTSDKINNPHGNVKTTRTSSIIYDTSLLNEFKYIRHWKNDRFNLCAQDVTIDFYNKDSLLLSINALVSTNCSFITSNMAKKYFRKKIPLKAKLKLAKAIRAIPLQPGWLLLTLLPEESN